MPSLLKPPAGAAVSRRVASSSRPTAPKRYLFSATSSLATRLRATLLLIALIIIFPQIVLFLPRLLS